MTHRVLITLALVLASGCSTNDESAVEQSGGQSQAPENSGETISSPGESEAPAEVPPSRGERSERGGPLATSTRASADQVMAGLERCGAALERIEAPGRTPTFASLMHSCSGVFAMQQCRQALGREPFDRSRVAEACRADYCAALRPAPSFCTTEMATDELFLAQFAPFSRMALETDLEPVLGPEGAEEIAALFENLVARQALIR